MGTLLQESKCSISAPNYAIWCRKSTEVLRGSNLHFLTWFFLRIQQYILLKLSYNTQHFRPFRTMYFSSSYYDVNFSIRWYYSGDTIAFYLLHRTKLINCMWRRTQHVAGFHHLSKFPTGIRQISYSFKSIRGFFSFSS
jgi:hypothetical protein